MTAPSTDELIDAMRNLKIEYCDLDMVNAAADRLETLRKAAEVMAEALGKALNYLENTEGEFGITLISGGACRAALAAYEELTP